MESLVQFIKENLLHKKNYKYFPKTKEKLKSIIKKRIKEDGNEVDLNDIDTSKITDMSSLFRDTGFNGDISKWDVSNVTNMNRMFMGCENFNQDISNWNVSSVRNMSSMFYKCNKFNQDISKWDVSKVKNMSFMFYDCTNFNSDISNWDVSNVTLMLGMFDNCTIEEKYKPKFTKTMEDKITIKKENVLNAYNQASEEQKSLLENMFGKDIFNPKDIKERVKTFEDACSELGDNHPLVEQYRLISAAYKGDPMTEDLIAYLKLRVISAALNEGWKPQFTEDEKRWYPWFTLWTEEELKDKSDEWKADKKLWRFGGASDNSYCGLAFAGSSYAWTSSNSASSARFAVKSEDLAEYCGKQFIDIWADFLLKQK